MKSIRLSILFVVVLFEINPVSSQLHKSELRKALENALVNDSSNLLALHDLFYPPATIVSDVTITLDQCLVTVRNITGPHDVPFYGDKPAFIDCDIVCGGVGVYCLNITTTQPYVDGSIQFFLSGNANANSHSKLLSYIGSGIFSVMMDEYVSFLLFKVLTFSQLNLEENGKPWLQDISLSIDTLHLMPTYREVILELEYILIIWARYYARTSGTGGIMNTEKKDSDRMLVQSTGDYGEDTWTSPALINLTLYGTLNSIIAIIGIYYIPRLLRQFVSYSQRKLFTKEECSELYLATVIISAIINIVCTAIPYYLNCHQSLGLAYYFCSGFYNLAVILPFSCLIFIIEVVSLWFAAKGFDLGTTCCCSNRYVLRALHTLAFCHILWFLHRVGCNLLVAAIFIALAPTQTLAAICLIYFVILSSILYLTFNVHFIRKIRCSCKSCCPIICKLFVVFVLYILGLAFICFLTVFFNALAQHGLTSSGLGSVILSLVAPTIVFIITLRLKKQVGKYFSTRSSNQSAAVTSNESLRNPDQRGHGDIAANNGEMIIDFEHPTVNSPLLAKD